MSRIAHDAAINSAACMDRLGRFNHQKREKNSRRRWLVQQLATGNGVNRQLIIREFSVSRATATNDLEWFKATYPGALIYDQAKTVHRLAEAAKDLFLPVLAVAAA